MSGRTPTHVDSAEAFGRRLLAARRAAGVTQGDIDFPGCSVGYISRLEHGHRVPSLQVVHELARRLGVTPQWLARGDETAVSGPDEQLRDAELALRFGQHEEAQEAYDALAGDEHPAPVRARALAGLGQLAFLRDEATAAIAHLRRAYELDPALADPGAAETLGRACAAIGAEEEALAVFRRELERATSMGDGVNRLRFSVLLANALIDVSDFGGASTLLAAALDDPSVTSDPLARARVQWSQSRLHAHRGDTALARSYAGQAVALLETTEHTLYIARAYRALSHIELDAGRPDEALGLIERGRSLAARAVSPLDEAVFALEEARALAQLGRHEEAAALAMGCVAGFEGAHPVDVGRSYAELAAALERSGDSTRALEIYELALEFHERRPSRYLAEACAQYAGVLEREGSMERAFAAYKRAATLRTELARS